MRLIADVHISPRTVQFLNLAGHDVIAIHSVLPADSPDRDIIRMATELDRAVLTQDLGFSGILATLEDDRVRVRPLPL